MGGRIKRRGANPFYARFMLFFVLVLCSFAISPRSAFFGLFKNLESFLAFIYVLQCPLSIAFLNLWSYLIPFAVGPKLERKSIPFSDPLILFYKSLSYSHS